MTAWIAAGMSASVAAALACAVPDVVRRLPMPAIDDSAAGLPPKTLDEERSSTHGDGSDESDAADRSRAGRTGRGGRMSGRAAVAGVITRPPPTTYSEIADTGWFLPTGVVASAAAAWVLGLVFGVDRVLVVMVPLVPVGYALAVTDARAQLLPRRVVVAATLGALGAFVAEWAVTLDLDTLLRSVLGLAAARAVFWLMWFLGGGVAFGDVRLAALTGLLTARVGWDAFLVALGGALMLATAFAAVSAVAMRRQWRGAAVPLGPFLILGAWVGILARAGT